MPKMNLLRPVLTTLFLGALVSPLAAQEDPFTGKVDNIGYGTRAGEFLLLPVGARGAALGQAVAAIADDASALYWNPAGIGFLRSGSLHVSHMDYLAETSFTWVGAAMPIGEGTWIIGAQVGGFNFGDQPVYTVQEPDGTGSTYSNTMFASGLTVAMNVTDRFAFGVTGKYIQESFSNTRGSTFAADLGTNYHTQVAGRPFKAAFSIMNLGGEIRLSGSDLRTNVTEPDPNVPEREDQAELQTHAYALPVMFKVGLGWEALSTPTNRLTLVGEFWQPQQNNTSSAFGAEYMLRPRDGSGLSAALRGGYTFEPDRSLELGGRSFDDESSDGLSFGGGLGWHRGNGTNGNGGGLGFSLDYAYRKLGLLGNSNMFSVSVSW